MTRTRRLSPRFKVGVGLVLLSAAIYVWHDRSQSLTVLDLIWHGGPLLIALALLVPRDTYRATLDFLGAVLRPHGKDDAR